MLSSCSKEIKVAKWVVLASFYSSNDYLTYVQLRLFPLTTLWRSVEIFKVEIFINWI